MKRYALLTLLATPTLMMGTALSGELALNGGPNQQIALGQCTTNAAAICMDFDWTGTSTDGTSPVVVTSGPLDGGQGGNGTFLITNNFVANNGGIGNGGGLLTPATQVTVGDLNTIDEAPGATVSYPNFITFNNGSVWTIQLTQILAGNDGAAGCTAGLASGQLCSPQGTPLNEQNFCFGSTCTVDVGFTFEGTATNGADNSTSSVIGTFNATFSGTNYQTINADIANGMSVVTSDSGTLNITPIPTTVPEPMPSALIGLGLFGIGFMRWKRRTPQVR